MNWTEIKEKYPKAYTMFANCFWGGIDFEINKKGNLYFTQIFNGGKSYATSEFTVKQIIASRRFYDFFDDNGIYICPIQILWKGKVMWEYRIGSKKHIQIERLTKQRKTRTEAEEQAFERAFAILEGKL